MTTQQQFPIEIISRAVKAWKVSPFRAADMLAYQEDRELETRRGKQGFTMETDDGPVWYRAVDAMA